MSGRKKSGKEVSIIRSSAAEYLTFIAASGTSGIDAVYGDENIWLTQKMMGVLYDVDVRTINYHLKKIFSDSECRMPSRKTLALMLFRQPKSRLKQLNLHLRENKK